MKFIRTLDPNAGVFNAANFKKFYKDENELANGFHGFYIYADTFQEDEDCCVCLFKYVAGNNEKELRDARKFRDEVFEFICKRLGVIEMIDVLDN